MKCSFEGQFRRFCLPLETKWASLVFLLESNMYHLEGKAWTLKYEDEEKDQITVLTEVEWKESLRVCKLMSKGNGGSLFLRLFVELTDTPYSVQNFREHRVERLSPQKKVFRKSRGVAIISERCVPAESTALRAMTLRESCDLATRNAQDVATKSKQSLSSECDRSFQDTLSRCDSLYKQEVERFSSVQAPECTALYNDIYKQCDKYVSEIVKKADPARISSSKDDANKIDDEVTQLLAKLNLIGTEMRSECDLAQQEIIEKIMRW